jgi:hypothetical protein
VAKVSKEEIRRCRQIQACSRKIKQDFQKDGYGEWENEESRMITKFWA